MIYRNNIQDDSNDNPNSWHQQQKLRAVEAPLPSKALCSTTPILRHCVSQPNLTEPMDIDENEENGQKRNCAPLPLFWGTVYPNLT